MEATKLTRHSRYHETEAGFPLLLVVEDFR